jgi:hypothetical protein
MIQEKIFIDEKNKDEILKWTKFHFSPWKFKNLRLKVTSNIYQRSKSLRSAA